MATELEQIKADIRRLQKAIGEDDAELVPIRRRLRRLEELEPEKKFRRLAEESVALGKAMDEVFEWCRQNQGEIRAIAAPMECILERLEVLEAFLGAAYREFEAAHRAEIVNG